MSPRVPGGMVAEVAALRAEIAELESELADVRVVKARYLGERDASDRARDGVADTLASVQAELDAVTAERDDLAAQRDRLSDHVKLFDRERDRLLVERGVFTAFVPLDQIPALRAHLRAIRRQEASS